MALFTLSIGVLSLGVINICYVFLNGYGIFTCYVEMNKESVKNIVQKIENIKNV
jgi:hypothetical protein